MLLKANKQVILSISPPNHHQSEYIIKDQWLVHEGAPPDYNQLIRGHSGLYFLNGGIRRAIIHIGGVDFIIGQ